MTVADMKSLWNKKWKDELLKISSSDASSWYGEDKIVAGSWINITKLTDGSWNETLSFSASTAWWGFKANVYFTTDDSDVSWYKKISYNISPTETELSWIVNNNEVLFRTYLYDDPIDTTVIDAGTWVVNTRYKVSWTPWVTQLAFEAFLRHTDTTETTLFKIYSDELNSTVYETIRQTTNQPSFACLATDRFWVRIYGKTTHNSNITISTIVWDGDGAYFITPISLRHWQLRDLAWSVAGHTGVPNTYPVFDENWEATYTPVNPIEITFNAFQALIVANGLIPWQRYLITDYRTFRYIVGAWGLYSNDYFEWDVEQIYVQALTTSKVAPLGWSKTYPDEQITYRDRQEITTKSFAFSWDWNAWVGSGNISFDFLDSTHLDVTATYPLSVASNIYAYLNKDGANIYFMDSNKNIDWEVDEDWYFHLLNTEYTVDLWRDIEWSTSDGNMANQEIDVISDTEIAMTTPETRWDDYIWDFDKWAGGRIVDNTNWRAGYYDIVNKWIAWDIDATSGNFTLLRNGRDFQAYVDWNNGVDSSEYPFTIDDYDTFIIEADFDISPGTNYNWTTYLDITWSDNTTTYIGTDNYWTYREFYETWWGVKNGIRLIWETHNLQTDLSYINWTVFGNSTIDLVYPASEDSYIYFSCVQSVDVSIDLTDVDYFYMNYQYIKQVNWYISARRDVKRDFYVDLDFRWRKLRRYGLINLWDYVIGATYYPWNIVKYNNRYYLCFPQWKNVGTTTLPNNNERRYNIWPSENIYWNKNISSYLTTVYYDPNNYTDRYPFSLSQFDWLPVRPMHVKIKSAPQSWLDLNCYIHSFGWNISNSDVSVYGTLTLNSTLKNTYIRYVEDSVIMFAQQVTVDQIVNSICDTLSDVNWSTLASVFTIITVSKFNNIAAFIGQRIQSCPILTDLTNIFCSWGFQGNEVNQMYNVFSDMQFIGNSIMNWPSTTISWVTLLKVPWFSAWFNQNTITWAIQSVTMELGAGFFGNTVIGNLTNWDVRIGNINYTTFGANSNTRQVDHIQSSINQTKFFSQAVLQATTYFQLNGWNTFSGAFDMNSWCFAFEFSGITPLPVVWDKYRYQRQNINSSLSTGTENDCEVRLVDATLSWGTYSGIMILSTKRKPATTGTLTKSSWGWPTSITYTNSYKMNVLRGTTSATPLPAIWDIYQNSWLKFYYAWATSTYKYFMCSTNITVNLTLTRVTGSWADPITFNSQWEWLSNITNSFFANSAFMILWSFWLWNINNSIFNTAITNVPKIEWVLQGVFQTYELPLQINWEYRHAIRRKKVTTTYFTQSQDDVIECDGTFTVTLFDATYFDGKTLTIKNTWVGTITVNATGWALIDWSATATLTAMQAVTVISNWPWWSIINKVV